MSCRYWSKAPEGFARKNAFALPPFDRAIARAPTVDGGDVGEEASGANIGITRQWCKSPQFSTSQITRAVIGSAICPRSTSLWTSSRGWRVRDRGPPAVQRVENVDVVGKLLITMLLSCRLEHFSDQSFGGRDRPTVLLAAVHDADRPREGEAYGSGTRFLVELHGRDEIVHRRVLGALERQALTLGQRSRAVRVPSLRDLERFGEPSFVRHADGHRFAVKQREPGGRLDGVPDRVTEVENRAASGFALVRGDYRGLDLDRALHGPGQRGGVLRGDGGLLALEGGEVVRRGDHTMLDRFGHPGRDLDGGEGAERVEVRDDAARLVECPQEILARRRVHPRLPPDRRVDHGEERRGDLHVGHAAQIGRGDEARDVPHDAAPERNDGAIPAELRRKQLVAQRRPRLARLVPLPGGELEQLGVERAVVASGHGGAPAQGADVRIGDDGGARRVARRSDEGGQVGEEPAADQDVVRRVAVLRDRHVDLHHVISGTPALRLATRARTKRRSDSRFKYGTTEDVAPAPCSRCSRTTARSARRQTVRARCRAAPLGTPPGRMNCVSGGSSASWRSIASSNTATCWRPIGGRRSALAAFVGPIIASSAPMWNSSRCTCSRSSRQYGCGSR